MKKIIFFIITLVTLLPKVNAAGTFGVNFNGNNEFNSTITFSVVLNNVSVNGVCGGICGLSAVLNYDSSKLTLSSITPSSNFELTQGSKLLLLKTTGVGSGSTILNLTFTNKSLADGETTTVSLTGIEGSDGDGEMVANNISKTLKYVKPNTSVTNPDSKEAVIDPSSIKEEKSASSNNDLASLKLSEGSINFSKKYLVYDVILTKNISKIKIEATAEDEKATVKGLGEFDVKEGMNEFEIIVTAENKDEKKYLIRLYKDLEEMNLSEESEDISKKNENKKYIILFITFTLFLLGGIIIYLFKKKTN